MLVKDRMSSPVITIQPGASLDDAWRLLTREKISRLPVVDARGKLVGIITEKQLLRYSPSQATTLDAFEIKGAMKRIKVDEAMTRTPITVAPDEPIEEVARIMVDNKISGMPVVEGDTIVGIITETDLFKLFLESLGAREPGVRLTISLQKAPGQLAKITKVIFDAGGNIIAISSFMGKTSDTAEVTLKVENLTAEKLIALVKPLALEILDVRASGVA